MPAYVDDLLAKYNVTGKARSPASLELCTLSLDSSPLQEDLKEEFRSRIAKIMYLAKLCRPDCLLTVCFLATRVTNPTKQDWKKLHRLLCYLNETKELGIVLKPGRKLGLTAYIDASYGIHADGKSHSGITITIGGAPIHAESVRQSIVTKSSTEAELVAISDGLSTLIWSRDFLIEQGYNMGPAALRQDNLGTIAMAEKGHSTSKKTRHINIRYFFVTDRISSGEVELSYTSTDEMIADLLTKPIIGEQFIALRDRLLNCFY